MRLQQAGLRVTDLDRSLRFYTRQLGLKLVKRGDTRSWGGGLWALLEDPVSHRVIELNAYPKGSLFAGPYHAGDGLDHLDFTIGKAPVEELEKVYRTLLRNGGRTTGYEPSSTAGWMASVLDPDGLWVTIGREATAEERRRLTAGAKPKRRRTTARKKSGRS